ncbi:hypothetical protein [Comamonas thiooxydans]|uniref:hypothetical protein n=1 Tax=Comamonas thiooxydans TaxID=363952 RepID=UPI00209BEE4B|nr:hypothetical protein [Comamonas thiooxydans]MCO8250283.1 hypothetical protein [Comamonas thiooxydans]
MINYVLFNRGWADIADENERVRTSQRIEIENYDEEMRGHIYCPMCRQAAFRSPRHALVDRKGRRYFSHTQTTEIPCDWRIQQVVAVPFDREEDVERAIANEDLVVIHSFMQQPPEQMPGGAQNFYDEVPADVDGELSTRPLSRHRNGERAWPTKITTVKSIARRFDRNLGRYYSFPYNPAPTRLIDSIHYVASIEDEPDLNRHRLFLGKVVRIYRGPYDGSVCNIYFQYPRGRHSIADFCIKTPRWLLDTYEITNANIDQYALVYGPLQVNGVGLCVRDPAYGEVALIPPAYNAYVEELIREQ